MSTLPDGFVLLEPFVEQWAVHGSANRARRRDESSAAEREAFYSAARGQLDAALAWLDAKPLDGLDAKDARLLDLMLSLAHVSLAVEMQAEDEPGHMRHRQHMHITRTPADTGHQIR